MFVAIGGPCRTHESPEFGDGDGAESQAVHVQPQGPEPTPARPIRTVVDILGCLL